MRRAEVALRTLASDLGLPGWARLQILKLANALARTIARAQPPTPP